jgi:cytidylate kinase
MSFIITIGRQYGSGGRFIGQELAKELNVPFYDNDLLAKAAVNSGIDEDVVKLYDEKKDGVFAGFIPSLYGYDMTMGQKVFLAQFEVIKKIAAEGSAVIVGRCADYVLKDKDNVVSVFIMAPEEDCVKRAVKYYGMDEKKAREYIKKTDKKRASYYNFYTDRKWSEASNYDLCINSSIGIKESVDVIKAFAEKKLKQKL